MSRICPNFQKTLRRLNADEGRIDVAIARCKSWLCPYCRVVNAKRLRAAVVAQVPALGVTVAWFGTITAPGADRTALGTYRALHKAWPKLRQWIHRHYGPFNYLAIYERHKSGAYHLHWVALFSAMPTHPTLHKRLRRQIRAQASKWRIGYIADVRQIDGKADGVVKYMSKSLSAYLTKGTQSTKDGLPRNARLFYLSRGIKSTLPGGTDGGEWGIAPLLHITALGIAPHWSMPDGRRITYDDFGDSDYWPDRSSYVDKTE